MLKKDVFLSKFQTSEVEQETLPAYLMGFAGLVGVFVKSNQHNHWYLPYDPQQDLKGEGCLLEAVRLVLQDDIIDNTMGHFLSIS